MIFGIYCIRFPEYLPCKVKSTRGTNRRVTHAVFLASYLDADEKIHTKIRKG
jgi:hypothetical protein